MGSQDRSNPCNLEIPGQICKSVFSFGKISRNLSPWKLQSTREMNQPFEKTRLGSAPVLGGILALIAILLFFPPQDAEFVYDGRLQILSDTEIHDPGMWPSVLTFRVLAMDILDFNRPVHLASLMVDSFLFGKSPFGYRLTSVLLHAAVTVLLFATVLKMIGTVGTAHPYKIRVAFAAALLFAVHPLVTEAVCEPTYREDLLSALFCISALFLAGCYDPLRKWTVAFLAACPLVTLLGAGSKENAVVIPFVLLAYWFVFRRQESPKLWLGTIGLSFALAGGFMVARFSLETPDSAIFTESPQYPGGSLQSALLLLPRILSLYVLNIVWPLHLAADYGLYSVRFLSLPLAIGILIFLIAGSLFLLWKDRRTAIPLFLIAGSLLPVLNLIPIYRAAADRYLYLPLVGVAMLIGLLLDLWLSKRGKYRFPLVLVVVLVVASVFGAICRERQEVWKNSLALWGDTAEKNPRSFTAAYGLGTAMLRADRLPEAENAFAHASRLSEEKRGDLWAHIAVLFHRQGRAKDVPEALRKAIQLDPKMADPRGAVETLHLESAFAEQLQELLDIYSRELETLKPEPEQ